MSTAFLRRRMRTLGRRLNLVLWMLEDADLVDSERIEEALSERPQEVIENVQRRSREGDGE